MNLAVILSPPFAVEANSVVRFKFPVLPETAGDDHNWEYSNAIS